jgi:hypothetical protein
VETYTDPTQSSLSILSIPSLSVPPLPNQSVTVRTIYYPPDAGLELDQVMQDHSSIDTSTSSPLAPNTVDVGSSAIASLQSLERPSRPNAGPVSYLTPSTHGVNSPTVDGRLISLSTHCSRQVYQAVNTPESVSAPYPTSAAIPVGFVNTPGTAQTGFRYIERTEILI